MQNSKAPSGRAMHRPCQTRSTGMATGRCAGRNRRPRQDPDLQGHAGNARLVTGAAPGLRTVHRRVSTPIGMNPVPRSDPTRLRTCSTHPRRSRGGSAARDRGAVAGCAGGGDEYSGLGRAGLRGRSAAGVLLPGGAAVCVGGPPRIRGARWISGHRPGGQPVLRSDATLHGLRRFERCQPREPRQRRQPPVRTGPDRRRVLRRRGHPVRKPTARRAALVCAPKERSMSQDRSAAGADRPGGAIAATPTLGPARSNGTVRVIGLRQG